MGEAHKQQPQLTYTNLYTSRCSTPTPPHQNATSSTHPRPPRRSQHQPHLLLNHHLHPHHPHSSTKHYPQLQQHARSPRSRPRTRRPLRPAYRMAIWRQAWREGGEGGVGGVLAYAFKPDTSIQTWALEEARRRLEVEGILKE